MLPDQNTDPITVSIPRGHMLEGQFAHLLLLLALLPGVFAWGMAPLDDGSWLGLDDHTWLWIAVVVPIVHQLIVAVLWRAQLCHSLLTRLFGDTGFVVWGALFMPLLLARPLALLGLGMSDTGSLAIEPLVGWLAGAVLLAPALWTLFSVKRYFGITRALGADHFFERYRTMPMVRKGAFAWSPNAMYTFAFLGLWAIALMTRSEAALAVALFQHAYIWVHWYCTEQPDAVVLYGGSPDKV